MKLIRAGIFFVGTTLLLGVGITAPAPADEGRQVRTINGEVLKITGTFEVVKGPNGKGVLGVSSDAMIVQEDNGQQVALRLGKNTKQDGVIDAGDKIEASIGPDGQVVSIRPAGGVPAQR